MDSQTQTVRDKRIAAGIPGALLARQARMDRARLCHIERGYSSPSEDEIKRLTEALQSLIIERRRALGDLLKGVNR